MAQNLVIVKFSNNKVSNYALDNFLKMIQICVKLPTRSFYVNRFNIPH